MDFIIVLVVEGAIILIPTDKLDKKENWFRNECINITTMDYFRTEMLDKPEWSYGYHGIFGVSGLSLGYFLEAEWSDNWESYPHITVIRNTTESIAEAMKGAREILSSAQTAS